MVETDTPDCVGMSGPDLLKYMGFDARKWAEAFCQIKELQGWSAADIDADLMTTWFANALMRGIDFGHASWEPVDTAPSDGTEVLVWGGRYESVQVAKADGDWWRRETKIGNNAIPTRWQPMPKGPTL